eukprot:m.296694 g.296694  ORF g.296694 m.296694 type:complete len:172 (-) comp20071_c0_seq7:385-900(-)
MAAFQTVATVRTKRPVTATHVPHDQLSKYMSNPLTEKQVQMTKALSHAILSMGERAHTMEHKVARLEALCDKMKTVLHASMLASVKLIPSEEDLQGRRPPMTSDAVFKKDLGGMDDFAASSDPTSQGNAAKKIGNGTLQKTSATDFQNLMAAMGEEMDTGTEGGGVDQTWM